jgi:hypothetical protein
VSDYDEAERDAVLMADAGLDLPPPVPRRPLLRRLWLAAQLSGDVFGWALSGRSEARLGRLLREHAHVIDLRSLHAMPNDHDGGLRIYAGVVPLADIQVGSSITTREGEQ